ncbi:MAG: 6-phosphogluconolactonase [Alphaproteobacteria bacterium]
MRVVEAEDPAAAAVFLSSHLRDLAATRRRVSLAVSGGDTPWPMLRALAKSDGPWQQLDVFQVDERIVPLEHQARNFRQVQESLETLPVQLHAMPVDDPDVDRAARDYEASLPDALDVTQLGLGDDGHTASLVRGDPVVDIVDRGVAVTAVYQGYKRMTLTYPAINRSGVIVWLVRGTRKRGALAALLAGDPSISAGRTDRNKSVVFADREALGGATL